MTRGRRRANAHQILNGCDHHEAVEDRDAGQRNEPDRRRDRKRHTSQNQSEHAADQSQRHAGEHDQRFPHRAESAIEQQQD
jgi:hypothetical protein